MNKEEENYGMIVWEFNQKNPKRMEWTKSNNDVFLNKKFLYKKTIKM